MEDQVQTSLSKFFSVKERTEKQGQEKKIGSNEVPFQKGDSAAGCVLIAII